MRCPACGTTSRDRLETCNRCGAPMAACAAGELFGALPASPADPRGEDIVASLDDAAIEVGDDDLEVALPTSFELPEEDGGPPFRIDDDLFAGWRPDSIDEPGAGAPAPAWLEQSGPGAAQASDLPPEPAFFLPDEEGGIPAGGQPIIDRDGEIPERYWAPEVAGLGRRAVALLADQAVLALALGSFFLGALLSLRLNGSDEDFLLSAAGLQATALPFALLAALLSLAYHAYFHGSAGRTPGKALAGVEVRTGDGAELSWRRAILRWFCSALGLACVGTGVAWALFEPRRRGWADLLSGTVIARRRGEPDRR